MNRRSLPPVLLAMLVAIAMVLAACGGASDGTDESVAAAGAPDTGTGTAPDDESDGESDDTEPDETAAPVRGDAGIPIECFDSDEAFAECDADGLVPIDCFDDEGYLLDECYPDQPDSSGPAVAAESADPGENAVSLAFDPSNDAFGFFNYGDEPGVVNLTPVEMQRMFGDDICANLVDGCTLTPPARLWMEQMNQSMSGGHCEGMAVLASLFYFDYTSPSDFGGDVTAEIEFDGNELLQREIAYWWVTQATSPGSSVRIDESPRAVVDALIEAFEADQAADQWWVMGIYKPDYSGGHAITPYAVEDNGDGTYSVFVYDNNYPLTGRILTVDYEANTWQYEASPNPDIEADLYEGDASTRSLEIIAIGPRLVEQEQSFADVTRGSLGGDGPAAPGQGGIEIWLEGDSNLLITAADGRRIGYLPDGSFVNEIEGATSNPLRFVVDVWDIDDEPVYRLPLGMTEFTITVDGSQLTEEGTSDVVLIGPGFDMVVEELILGPGEQDVIEVLVEEGDFFALNYSSEYSDSPDIWFGLVTDEADYEFITRASDIEPGGSFNVALDFANGDFILNTFDQQEYGIYELLVLRIDDEGEHVFGHAEIELLPDDTMYANFLEWAGDGSVMYLDFDYESDGTFDETIALEDEADSFYDS